MKKKIRRTNSELALGDIKSEEIATSDDFQSLHFVN